MIYPSRLSLDKHGKDRYEYCSRLLHTYIGDVELMQEFCDLREYVESLFGISIYGIVIEPSRNHKNNKVIYRYRFGTILSDSEELNKGSDYIDKIAVLTEYVKNYTGNTDVTTCTIVDEKMNLRWFFTLNTIENSIAYLTDMYGLNELRQHSADDIDVLFDYDQDLIKAAESGVISDIVEALKSEYNKQKCIDVALGEISVNFTSFESECDQYQKPIRCVNDLFEGHSLNLDKIRSVEERKAIDGTDSLYLTTFIDARGYVVLRVKWIIDPSNKTNDRWVSESYNAYPPDTLIDDTNCLGLLFSPLREIDYPKCIVSFNG